MAQQVQFIQLSQDEYDNLETKNAGSLYFTTDTHRIYKGEDLYASTTFDDLKFDELEATSIQVNGKDVSVEGHTHTTDDIEDFPTKVSELENDVPYATQNDLDITDETANDALNRVSNAENDILQINSRLSDVIPDQASVSNQLADKDFVNSSIATNTAYFKGTFNSVDELPTGDVTNNDYAFVVGQDENGNTTYKRYKFNGSDWAYEYTLNNSSFTASQWATINSGLVANSFDDYAKAADIDTKIHQQPTLTFSGEYEDGTEFSFEVVTK